MNYQPKFSTLGQAESYYRMIGEGQEQNRIDGLNHDQLLQEAGMDEKFVRENKITDKEIRETLKY